jgi:hypothetical protein
LEDQNREAAHAEIEINDLCHCFQCLAVPCNTGPDEIYEFVLDSDDKKSAEQVLMWLNSWWTTTANDVPPPDECGPVARALCQCFALQHDKCLVCQPGLTGFSFSEEVCVCVFARDHFHPLAHQIHEWGKPENSSAVLFN